MGVPVAGQSTIIVDRVGKVMFAVYQVTVIIVLVNMLIAMMSHSFEAIQVSKHARLSRADCTPILVGFPAINSAATFVNAEY